MAKVLIVDDEAALCDALAELMTAEGFAAVVAGDAGGALERVRADRPDVVLLDLNLPGRGGLEILPELFALDPQVTVIILTGHGDIATAVQAMRLGAYDYLTKTAPIDEVAATVRRAVERRELLAQVETLKGRQAVVSHLSVQMGPSAAIARVIEQVEQVAGSSFTVLIQGETGTGKELVARAIHAQSPRRDGPFVALDCGAIPETLIESELFGHERGAFTGAERRREGHMQFADGGTLFLDEIVNLPLTTQAKLLRALQERHVQPLGAARPIPVDARIIAACNVSLEAETRGGRFRQDLYYRLNEFVISLPALRERREDIVHLARRFLDEAAMELRRPLRGLSDPAIDLLLAYAWPGNVRELRNVIRQAALRSHDVILPQHLAHLGDTSRPPDPAVNGGAEGASLRELAQSAAAEAERQAIRRVLEACGGNKSEAARALKTDYKTLHLKMRRYGISSRTSGSS